jgi:hypothetical protein
VQAKKTTKKNTRSKRIRPARRVKTSRRARISARRVAPLLPVAPTVAPALSAPVAQMPSLPPVSRMTSARMIALVAVFIMVAAMLVAMHPSSQRIAAAVDLQPQVQTQLADAATAPQLDTQEGIRPAVMPAPRIAVERPKPETKPKKSAIVPARPVAEPVTKAPVESVVHVLPAEPVTRIPAVAPTAVTRASESGAMTGVEGPVTITGCLEIDESDNTFRLTDTSGADAPTARSWRSGFLRKRSAPIDLVDAANALRLRSYVGQRIAATGVLTNREMEVRSLRRAGQSCK